MRTIIDFTGERPEWDSALPESRVYSKRDDSGTNVVLIGEETELHLTTLQIVDLHKTLSDWLDGWLNREPDSESGTNSACPDARTTGRARKKTAPASSTSTSSKTSRARASAKTSSCASNGSATTKES